MNMRKSAGPSTDPWGTSLEMSKGAVVYPPTSTLDVLLLEKMFAFPLMLMLSFYNPNGLGRFISSPKRSRRVVEQDFLPEIRAFAGMSM